MMILDFTDIFPDIAKQDEISLTISEVFLRDLISLIKLAFSSNLIREINSLKNFYEFQGITSTVLKPLDCKNRSAAAQNGHRCSQH